MPKLFHMSLSGSDLSLKNNDIDLTIFKNVLFKDEPGVWTMLVDKEYAEAGEPSTIRFLAPICDLMCKKECSELRYRFTYLSGVSFIIYLTYFSIKKNSKILVTVASAKKSLSKLKLTKTYLSFNAIEIAYYLLLKCN